MTTLTAEPERSGTLERYVTAERFGPYRAAAGGDVAGALVLYRWNGRVSGAMHEVIGCLEVLLRNAVDEQLQAWHVRAGHCGDWWDDPLKLLEGKRHDDVVVARSRVRRRPVTHGRVLAELSFGLWRFLLSSRYEASLWTPALRHAFPLLRPARRQRIYRPIDDLHKLRNRIAHHEPVHRLDLAAREADAVFVAACIHGDLADWVRETSRVGAVLAERPTT